MGRIDLPSLAVFRGADPNQARQARAGCGGVAGADAAATRAEQLILCSSPRSDEPATWRNCGFGGVCAECCVGMEGKWILEEDGS